tara:strand:+ start:21 stop:641 length:621 start_codon:yes stop_codon:yes gene_type:complete
MQFQYQSGVTGSGGETLGSGWTLIEYNSAGSSEHSSAGWDMDGPWSDYEYLKVHFAIKCANTSENNPKLDIRVGHNGEGANNWDLNVIGVQASSQRGNDYTNQSTPTGHGYGHTIAGSSSRWVTRDTCTGMFTLYNPNDTANFKYFDYTGIAATTESTNVSGAEDMHRSFGCSNWKQAVNFIRVRTTDGNAAAGSVVALYGQIATD